MAFGGKNNLCCFAFFHRSVLSKHILKCRPLKNQKGRGPTRPLDWNRLRADVVIKFLTRELHAHTQDCSRQSQVALKAAKACCISKGAMPSEAKEETWPCDTWSRENEIWKRETSTVDNLYINVTSNENNSLTKFVWVSGFQIPILYTVSVLVVSVVPGSFGTVPLLKLIMQSLWCNFSF